MRPGLSTLQALAVAAQFGFTLAVAVGLGILVGQFLDGLLGTRLLFTLLGVGAGLASAIIGTIKLMAYIERRQAQPSANQDKEGD